MKKDQTGLQAAIVDETRVPEILTDTQLCSYQWYFFVGIVSQWRLVLQIYHKISFYHSCPPMHVRFVVRRD